ATLLSRPEGAVRRKSSSYWGELQLKSGSARSACQVMATPAPRRSPRSRLPTSAQLSRPKLSEREVESTELCAREPTSRRTTSGTSGGRAGVPTRAWTMPEDWRDQEPADAEPEVGFQPGVRFNSRTAVLLAGAALPLAVQGS